MATQTRVGAPASATGGLYAAPSGTALPTDAATPLDTKFKALSLIGEDGLSETENRSTDEVRAWGGSLARVLQTEYGIQVSFTFLTRDVEVLKRIYGAENVTVDTSAEGKTKISVKRNAKPLPRESYIAEIKDGPNHKLRLVYPDAQITEIGDVTYSHNSLIQFEVTLACYEDENGTSGYQYEEYTGTGASAA